jgi:hypothetical protein
MTLFIISCVHDVGLVMGVAYLISHTRLSHTSFCELSTVFATTLRPERQASSAIHPTVLIVPSCCLHLRPCRCRFRRFIVPFVGAFDIAFVMAVFSPSQYAGLRLHKDPLNVSTLFSLR